MRLFSVLTVLGLLGTRAFSHEPALHRFDVRDLVDVCASLNTELVVPYLGSAGIINQCVCLSGLPVFLQTNFVAVLAVSISGQKTVTDILTNLIINQSNCVFPEHSIPAPACVNGQPSCGFTCTDGFTASLNSNPRACVCSPPAVVCNGQCKASGLCPSAQATLKKRWAGSGSCSERGPGWAACGVFGGGPRGWECVNTARDLESCGGCTMPLTPYSPIGEDCSALPGVADVACLHGECAVYRCFQGYRPAPDGHSCVRKYSQFNDAEGVLASV